MGLSMKKKPLRRRSAGQDAGGGLDSAGDTALHLRQTRLQHAQERSQDFAEAIADLMERSGEARAVDLAKRLGVSHVTVIKTVARMRAKWLVTTQPYRAIFLTPAGRALADRSRHLHEVAASLLEALGVSKKAAHADAEGIAHHLGEETLGAIQSFLKKQKKRVQAP